jgi:uncharacterized SAM-binding protein YcdF (DUF218 family)
VFFLYKLLGGLATPPGCFFAILMPLSFWVARDKRRASRRIGIALFALLLIMYALFMPVTAAFLMARLELGRPDLPADGTPTLVVVLAGGGTHPIPGSEEGVEAAEIELAEQSLQRLIEGVRAARLLGCPLLYSGGYDEGDRGAYENEIRRIAADAGFDGELLLETLSRTSWENMKAVSKIVEARGFKRLVISTTAYHVKRALWTAAQIMPDTELVAWPSGWRSTRDRLTAGAFGVSARAFLDNCTALREIVGLLVYKFYIKIF